MGDAAHAMLPHLGTSNRVLLSGSIQRQYSSNFKGAGVGQGLEDVLLLFRLLTHPRAAKHNIHVSLIYYPPNQNQRSKRSRHYCGRMIAYAFQGPTKFCKQAREREKFGMDVVNMVPVLREDARIRKEFGTGSGMRIWICRSIEPLTISFRNLERCNLN